ncbi:MAG: SDR family NAD(P)-dependent oxidoreductase, partial [Cyanobacteriota bacterium]|nr:SDR family NAD(P)-dependent oxidoreductase [Cyanobacteriota bacterium]
PLSPTLQIAERQSWLIFADETAIAEGLIAEFRKQQHPCIVVRIGDRFTRLDSSNYAIAPHEPDDYLHLIRHLRENACLPQNILHAWSVPADCRDLDRNFYSLLFLARALGEQQQQDSTTLTLLSSQLYDVVGTETLCPEKATLQGPCRVIPQEFPQIACKIVDIEPQLADSSAIAQLYAELTAKATPNLLPFIAYRQQRRWVQTIEPCPLPPVEAPSSLLKEGGTYLITGGLGGIGLTLAETLANTVRAQLILIGRSGLPDREDWFDWLATEGEEDKISQKIRKIQQMESWGARVLVLSADSSDEEQMREAIAIAEQHFGSICGVIHTAGVAGGRSILLKTREQADAILAAKVRGTRLIERLFADKPLDFILLNSSVSSFTGGLGQIDYCAANAFLDAFARDRQTRQGKRTLSIGWDTWQTVGMAVNTAVPERLRQHRQLSLELGLTPAEGMEVFQRILSHPQPHYITSTKDLRSLLARSSTLQSRQQQLAFLHSQSATSTKESTPQPRPNLKVAYTAPQTPTEVKIAEIWQNCLGFAEIGIHDDFFELGGHSLLATQLISQLRQTFEQDIPLSRIFETPTIAGLAAILDRQLSSHNPIQPTPRDASHLSTAQVDALLQKMLD